MTTYTLFFPSESFWNQSAPVPENCASFFNRVMQLNKRTKKSRESPNNATCEHQPAKRDRHPEEDMSESDADSQPPSPPASPKLSSYIEEYVSEVKNFCLKDRQDQIQVWYRDGQTIPEQELTLADIIGGYDGEETVDGYWV